MPKKFAVRMWGRGNNTFCLRSLRLECGEGEVTQFVWEGERTHEKQKGRKSRGCDCDFQRVFSLEGLGLGLKLELNLEDVGRWN